MSLPDTITFILTSASKDDIDRIYQACNDRVRQLRQIDAAAVQVGAHVTLHDISPKYLIGLTGVVQSIQLRTAVVTLDETSTLRLRHNSKSRGYWIPDGIDRYDLAGIPLVSCKLDSPAA